MRLSVAMRLVAAGILLAEEAQVAVVNVVAVVAVVAVRLRCRYLGLPKLASFDSSCAFSTFGKAELQIKSYQRCGAMLFQIVPPAVHRKLNARH